MKVIFNKEILGQVTGLKEVVLVEEAELNKLDIRCNLGNAYTLKKIEKTGMRRTKRDSHTFKRCNCDLLVIKRDSYYIRHIYYIILIGIDVTLSSELDFYPWALLCSLSYGEKFCLRGKIVA